MSENAFRSERSRPLAGGPGHVWGWISERFWLGKPIRGRTSGLGGAKMSENERKIAFSQNVRGVSGITPGQFGSGSVGRKASGGLPRPPR